MLKTLARRPDDLRRLRGYAESPAWQRVWLNLESENWRSLVVLPMGEYSPLELVRGLASVAWQQRGTPLVVADLREVGLSALGPAQEELRRRVESGERVVIAVHSLDKNPATMRIAREADKVVLCVCLGSSRSAHVRESMRQLGSQQCLGAILVRGGGCSETSLSVVECQAARSTERDWPGEDSGVSANSER